MLPYATSCPAFSRLYLTLLVGSECPAGQYSTTVNDWFCTGEHDVPGLLGPLFRFKDVPLEPTSHRPDRRAASVTHLCLESWVLHVPSC